MYLPTQYTRCESRRFLEERVLSIAIQRGNADCVVVVLSSGKRMKVIFLPVNKCNYISLLKKKYLYV